MTDKTPEALADEAMLTGVHFRNGTMDIFLQGGVCQLLADAFADQFATSGAENLEMTFTTNHRSKYPGISFVVTLRRADGKTPHQLRPEAEAKLAQAHQRIEELEKALRVAWAGFINLSADMESAPMQKQMRKHAAEIDTLLSTTQQEDSQA